MLILSFPQNCVVDILHVNILVVARAFSYYTLKIHFIVHFTQLYVLFHINGGTLMALVTVIYELL